MIVVWGFFFLVLFLEGFPERFKCNEVLVLQHLPGLQNSLIHREGHWSYAAEGAAALVCSSANTVPRRAPSRPTPLSLSELSVHNAWLSNRRRAPNLPRGVMQLCVGVVGLSPQGGTSTGSSHPTAGGGLQAVAGDHQQGGKLLLLVLVKISPFHLL